MEYEEIISKLNILVSSLRLDMPLVMRLYKMRCAVVRELLDKGEYICDGNIDRALQEKIRMN